jgi:predicted nucleic acid-binding protein
MLLKVYADTSVFGGCFEKEFEKWSNSLIDDFIRGEKILLVSAITLKELSMAPESVRDIINGIPKDHTEFLDFTPEAEKLAGIYISEKAVSKKFEGDAYHIAIATVIRADVLVSWNFKHIVNLNRIRLYNSVNLKCGYSMIEIRTPMEVTDED